MAQIVFDVTTQNLTRIITAMNALHPKPDESVLTDGEWAKECVRRIVISQVRRYEQAEAIKNVSVQEDNNLLT